MTVSLFTPNLKSYRGNFQQLICYSIVALMLVGCGKKKEDEDEDNLSLPLIAPAVDKAKPAAVPASTFATLVNANLSAEGVQRTAATTATGAEAAEALKDFFTDKFNSLSGYTKSGLIDAYIYDLDKRIEETNNNAEPSCLSGNAVAVKFDTGFAGHNATLNLQCIRSFESATDQSGSGSGIAYGRDDANYYMYLMLAQKNNANDKFGYAAIVNRATEAVQLLFLESSQTWNRTKFFNLKTTPSPKRMEFAIAGSNDGVGPASTQTAHTLSAGVRVVASEKSIRADGTAATQTGADGTPSGTTSTFDQTECFDATSLATAPATCASDAPTFEMVHVTSTEAASAQTTINTSLYTMQALQNLGIGIDVGPPAAQ